MQFASPLTDFGFFRVFGNENSPEPLIGFLNAVLGLRNAHEIDTVKLLEPFRTPKIATLRFNVMDVECRNRNGVEFVVEIQISYTEAFQRRKTYNPATEVDLKPSACALNFPKPDQIFGLSLLDFVMFPSFEHYFWQYEYHEVHENYCDEIRHYFIEVPKFDLKENELQTDLEKWCFFLKHTGELEVMPASLDSGLFRAALDLVNRGNMSRKEWEDYDRTSVWVQDQRGVLTAARKRARQEACEEAKRIARRMREHGFDTDFIAKITDVSLQEAEALNVRN